MRSKTTFSVFGALALGLVAETAGAAPALRVQVDQRGDFALIGNTLAQDCGSTVPLPVVGTIGQCGTNLDDTAPDVFWSSDTSTALADVSVVDPRSTAMLVLPAGATITHAYLYWGAAVATDASDASIVFDRPGTFTENVTAIASKTAPLYSHFTYQSVANVTSIVKQHGPGAYRVSGVNAMNPANLQHETLFAGWWMAVFYELSTDPPRNLALFDGLDVVNDGSARTRRSRGSSSQRRLHGQARRRRLRGRQHHTGDSSSSTAARSRRGEPRRQLLQQHPLVSRRPPSASPAICRSSRGTPGSMPASTSTWSTSRPSSRPGTPRPSGDRPRATTTPGRLHHVDLDLQPGPHTVDEDRERPQWRPAHPRRRPQYTITADDTGNDASAQTVLTDVLPAGVTYVPARSTSSPATTPA